MCVVVRHSNRIWKQRERERESASGTLPIFISHMKRDYHTIVLMGVSEVRRRKHKIKTDFLLLFARNCGINRFYMMLKMFLAANGSEIHSFLFLFLGIISVAQPNIFHIRGQAIKKPALNLPKFTLQIGESSYAKGGELRAFHHPIDLSLRLGNKKSHICIAVHMFFPLSLSLSTRFE